MWPSIVSSENLSILSDFPSALVVNNEVLTSSSCGQLIFRQTKKWSVANFFCNFAHRSFVHQWVKISSVRVLKFCGGQQGPSKDYPVTRVSNGSGAVPI